MGCYLPKVSLLRTVVVGIEYYYIHVDTGQGSSLQANLTNISFHQE